MSTPNDNERKETPWGLILMVAFFVLSLVGPVIFKFFSK